MIEINNIYLIFDRVYRYFLVYDFKVTYIRGSCLGIYTIKKPNNELLNIKDGDLQLEEVLL